MCLNSNRNLKIRYTQGLFKGASHFRFSRFLTSKLRHTSIFHSNYLYKGLKGPLERFLPISEINFFYPLWFLGNPRGPRKKCSIFFLKKTGVPQFSIFFDGTGLKWKIIEFCTYWQREMWRFCTRGVSGILNTKNVTPEPV